MKTFTTLTAVLFALIATSAALPIEGTTLLELPHGTPSLTQRGGDPLGKLPKDAKLGDVSEGVNKDDIVKGAENVSPPLGGRDTESAGLIPPFDKILGGLGKRDTESAGLIPPSESAGLIPPFDKILGGLGKRDTESAGLIPPFDKILGGLGKRDTESAGLLPPGVEHSGGLLGFRKRGSIEDTVGGLENTLNEDEDED